MPTSDDEDKTTSQLLAEIEGLQRQLAERNEATSTAVDEAPSQPVFVRPITRRTALGTWAAPVILSIPFSAVSRPRTAAAQACATGAPSVFATAFPTRRGRNPDPTMFGSPTAPPTASPTSFPTAFPTVCMDSFTDTPTDTPTQTPTDTPTDTPTQTPTETFDARAAAAAAAAATATAAAAATKTAAAAATATARRGSDPVPVLSATGLGAAVALVGAVAARRLLKKRPEEPGANDAKPDDSEADSGEEGGAK